MADFAEGLRGGTIDLACYAYPVNAPDIVVVPIITADAVVIARRGHPAIGKTLDVATYSALGHVTLVPALRAVVNVDQDIAARGLTRRVVYMVNKTWSIPPMLTAMRERAQLSANVTSLTLANPGSGPRRGGLARPKSPRIG
jgi:hypothetical protein